MLKLKTKLAGTTANTQQINIATLLGAFSENNLNGKIALLESQLERIQQVRRLAAKNVETGLQESLKALVSHNSDHTKSPPEVGSDSFPDPL